MMLIIAYGNPLRGDDGAGIVLGELLEQLCRQRRFDVERLVCHQLVPELVPKMVRPDISRVVFTDTRVATADSSGLSVTAEALNMSNSGQPSGHHLSPETLLLLAAKLYERSVRAWQVTVPGISFAHGQLLSGVTRRALAGAPPLLASFLNEIVAESAAHGAAPSF